MSRMHSTGDGFDGTRQCHNGDTECPVRSCSWQGNPSGLPGHIADVHGET